MNEVPFFQSSELVLLLNETELQCGLTDESPESEARRRVEFLGGIQC